MNQFARFITFVYVSDLNRSVEFYEQIPGLDLWLDQGTCRIYQATSNGLIGICQAEPQSKGYPPDPMKPNIILTLVTPDVDLFYQQIIATGHIVENPPSLNTHYNIYHFFLHDPDGYLIEIQKFLTMPDNDLA